ncbi:ATP-binding protein, partial [Microbacteriaceae bacterium K1510]|nr:ATP-binding protein [Microbacteriaceae bacterium K1510]
ALRYAHEQIEVKIHAEQKQLLIDIIDDGEGIPAHLLPNLFHRFVKGKDGENGLGLAISRAIIERCGGSVTAYNGLVTGATFRITFPVR